MKKVLMILFTLLIFISCSNVNTQGKINISEKNLDNKGYILVEMLENGIKNPLISNNSNVKIFFKGNKINGRGPVNNYFTNYSIENNKIFIENIASTRMAGSIEMMKLESIYFSLLKSNLDMELKGNTLIFNSSNGVSLIFKEIESLNLDNKKFHIMNDDLKKYGVTLEFKNGNIFGFSGVNRFFGLYKVEEDHLNVYNSGNTLMAGDIDKMNFEFYFLKFLQSNPKIKYFENVLELRDEENRIIKFEEIMEK